jgi:hypothetical protein
MKTTNYPVKSRSSGVNIVAARWLGGGTAGNCTQVAGRGISSVNYNAATGAYLITFEDIHPALLGVHITCGAAGSTATQNVANYQPASYDSAAGTLPIFVTDAASPTAQDLLTTEELSIIAVFAETAIDQ